MGRRSTSTSDPARDWVKRNFHWLMLGLMALVILVVVFDDLTKSKDTSKGPPETTEQQTREATSESTPRTTSTVKVESAPPAPALVSKPAVKNRPTPPGPGEQASAEYIAWAEPVVRSLISDHPDPRISRDLKADLDAKRVSLGIDPNKPPALAKATLEYVPNIGREVLKITIFSEKVVEMDRQIAEGVVLHEYVHIKHAQDGLLPTRLLREDYSVKTAHEARLRLESEHEAFVEQCRYSFAQGHTKLHNKCQWLKDNPGKNFKWIVFGSYVVDEQPEVYGYWTEESKQWALDPRGLRDIQGGL